MPADPTPLQVEEDYGTTAAIISARQAPTPIDRDNASSTKASVLDTHANINNFLNILGYIINLVTSYLGGVAGWFGGVTNAELSSKYQTLITPAASCFVYIWGVIFLFEGFFAVGQLLPKYREQPLVQEGVAHWYFLACAAQSAWTILFGYQFMSAAFVSMVALFVCLIVILKLQWAVVADQEKKTSSAVSLGETTMAEQQNDLTAKPPTVSYWLLRFPFAVHAGWISLATPLMLSVLLVARNDVESDYELWVAVISLPLVFGGCMGLLLREDSGAPAYVFRELTTSFILLPPMACKNTDHYCCSHHFISLSFRMQQIMFTVTAAVVAYGCIGICWELQAPANLVLARHDEVSLIPIFIRTNLY